jgi:glyoxylate carboligase
MITRHTGLDRLAEDLTAVIDDVAAIFGSGAERTVEGELDCDPTQPGRLFCRQYGLRLDNAAAAGRRLVEVVLPSLESKGWRTRDRSNARELIAQFSRDGADFNVHVSQSGGGVTIVGSTACVPVP